MRYVLAIAAVLSATLVAPAFAADGHVPAKTLKSLGLGSMQLLSDADGARVRGMSSSAVAMGTSLVSGLLIDPVTKSFIFGTSADASMATSENGGSGIPSHAGSSQNSNVNINLSVVTSTSSFSGTLVGGSGGSAVAWAQ
jgi:hypothetical protein